MEDLRSYIIPLGVSGMSAGSFHTAISLQGFEE